MLVKLTIWAVLSVVFNGFNSKWMTALPRDVLKMYCAVQCIRKGMNLNVLLNLQRGYAHQNPTVSPDATFFIPLSVINMSAEVCWFLPLGHVYYAVYIVDTNL